jgi:hypothetical protein
VRTECACRHREAGRERTEEQECPVHAGRYGRAQACRK